MAERESLFHALRQKRDFLPDGFRDEDGVWQDGPHRAEFDSALNDLELRISVALGHCKRELFLEAERVLKELVDG